MKKAAAFAALSQGVLAQPPAGIAGDLSVDTPPGLVPLAAVGEPVEAPTAPQIPAAALVPPLVPPPSSPAAAPAAPSETLMPFLAAAAPATSDGYIEVKLKAPPSDAVTLNSWAFLKGSMETLGTQVMNIMLVRKDIANAREDLKTQVGLWHNAEMELSQDNQRLRGQLKAAQIEYHRVADPVTSNIEHLKVSIAQEQVRSAGLLTGLSHAQSEIALDRHLVTSRKTDLTGRLKALNDAAIKEANQAHDHELQLRTDGVALHLKIKELQDRLSDGQKQLLIDIQRSEAEMKQLQLQLSEMTVGFQRLQEHIWTNGTYDQELAALTKSLQTETNTLLALQQEQNQETVACDHAVTNLKKVLAVEQAKASTRHQESVQLCTPINAQRAVLLQWMSQCEGTPLQAGATSAALLAEKS